MPHPPLNDIQDAIRPFHGPAAEFVPIPGGLESQAYLLVDEGREYIVRVNNSAAGFRKDEFAYRHFNSASLPIPAVLATGNIGATHSFCISERVAGITLQDMSAEQIPPTLQPTADVMKSIEMCDISITRGYGPFDEAGVGRYSSWPSYLQSLYREWSAMSSLLGDPILHSAHAELLRLSGKAPNVRCLVHGDFGSNNVLSDGQSITGVIDWSEAIVGDPLYDVANIFFWRTWLKCMDQLAAFFEHTVVFTEDARTMILCYQLHIGLREFYESKTQGNHSATTWAKTRLEELLRQTQ